MSLDHMGGDLSSFSMLDLFRMEAGEQARVLTDGLLQLERGAADPVLLEAMMRAAHSIKGAAAIVDRQAVVGLAHAMEDVFVAAQQGRTTVDAGAADTLLDSVDLMQRLAGADDDAGTDAAVQARIDALAALLARPAAAPAAPAPVAAAPGPAALPQPEAPAAAAAPADKPSAGAEAAPVPASALVAASDELLTLASQARVHAGQLRPWLDSMQRYKRQQRSVLGALEQLHEAIVAANDPRLLELALALRDRVQPLPGFLLRSIRDAENYERQASNVSARLADEVLALRMCRFGDGVHGLPRMVRDLGRSLGKDAQLVIEGSATLVERAVLARMEAPLNQLLRNAIDHGLETPAERSAAGKPATGTIVLSARHRGGMLVMEVRDDGRGVDPERIRQAAARRTATPAIAAELSLDELMEFLFLPGFSLKETPNAISGRGVGMDVVHEAVRRQNGTVRAESTPGAGFRTLITLPLTQSVMRALVVEVAGEAYAMPITRVEHVLRLQRSEARTLSGREYVDLDGVHLGLVAASQVLELDDAAGTRDDTLSVVVVGAGAERYGLVVDDIVGEQSLTVQPLEPVFGKLRDIAAGALLEDGAPVLIIDVPDLLVSIGRLLDQGASLQPARAAEAGSVRRVLVVDDSLTVREMQRKLLAGHGYRVEVALDGIDGWNNLRAGEYDLVITDIDMPRLDGIGLLERIRHDPRLQRLPVMIVSYKDRPEDRARGMEAGADYYLAKGSFHDATLLEAVLDLIGPAYHRGTA
ncbi:hybrid sensor histidine kinase/response regulator [Herbaspirillum sp. SJZ107]|uniref:hybrid sensor histidine kinase/response regulator n=1 Tax=Herbaspirillum sp. SJZ107 TaxID=2572881 RepID=UPI0011529671|nr:response regulator [Herbaspirillum sp. SJZ107]TQK10626.1 two-component system sensor histidine kinase and response regulator WspE [Herbaspirillum sp. SJZ107]